MTNNNIGISIISNIVISIGLNNLKITKNIKLKIPIITEILLLFIRIVDFSDFFSFIKKYTYIQNIPKGIIDDR